MPEPTRSTSPIVPEPSAASPEAPTGPRQRSPNTRYFDRATFQPIAVPGSAEEGGAIAKAQFATSIAPTRSELDKLRQGVDRPPGQMAAIAALARLAEASSPGDALAAAPAFAAVRAADLAGILAEVDAQRRAAAPTVPLTHPLAARGARVTVPGAARTMPRDNAKAILASLRDYLRRYGRCRGFLERLILTPTGTTRGELVASVPLAPGEKVAITHREWSTTEQEFEQYIQAAAADTMERATVGKSDMALSSQDTYELLNAIGPTSVSPGPFLGITIAGGAEAAAQPSAEPGLFGAAESCAAARLITSRASSTSVKDHRISFRLASQSGTSDEAARELHNPSTDRGMRIDYFRMMRTWEARLLRYGARQALDMVIPDIGFALRSRQRRLTWLNNQLAQGFEFALTPHQIDDGTASPAGSISVDELERGYKVILPRVQRVQVLAQTFKLDAPAKDASDGELPRYVSFDVDIGADQAVTEAHLTFDGPLPGYLEWKVLEAEPETLHPTLSAGDRAQLSTDIEDGKTWMPSMAGQYLICAQSKEHAGGFIPNGAAAPPVFLLKKPTRIPDDILYTIFAGGLNDVQLDQPVTSSLTNSWRGRSGKLTLACRFRSRRAQEGMLMLHVKTQITDRAWLKWQEDCWTILRDAALAQYQRQREAYKAERDALVAGMERDDPQWLRRLEREQIMRGVLRWLVPGFETGWEAWWEAEQDSARRRPPGVGSASPAEISPASLDDFSRYAVLTYGDLIRFLHQAIEWDYVAWIAYPYFWDTPVKQDEKLYLQHADATHREFLRASSARVFLTLRPGYEDAFAHLLERGALPDEATPPAQDLYKEVAGLNAFLNAAPSDAAAEERGLQLGPTWVEYTPTGGLDMAVSLIPLTGP